MELRRRPVGKRFQESPASATEMAGAVESTSVTTEELARSFRTVAEHAKQLESAAQTTASNVNRDGRVRRRGGGHGGEERGDDRRGGRLDRAGGPRGEERSRRASRPSPSWPSRSAGTATRARGLFTLDRPERRPPRAQVGERLTTVARDGGGTVKRSIAGLTRDPERRHDRLVDRDEGDGAPRRRDRRHRADHQLDRGSNESPFLERQHRSRESRASTGAASRSSPRRSVPSPDRAAASSGEIAKIVHGLQSTARDAVGADDRGAAGIADEAAASWPRTPKHGARRRSSKESRRSGAPCARCRRRPRRGRFESLSSGPRAEPSRGTTEQTRSIGAAATKSRCQAAESRWPRLQFVSSSAKMSAKRRRPCRRRLEQGGAPCVRSSAREQPGDPRAPSRCRARASSRRPGASDLAQAVSQMRASTQQTVAAMNEQGRTVATIGTQAQEVGTAMQRAIGGLNEQAKGAMEISRAMDDSRKQTALMVSKAVVQQAAWRETDRPRRRRRLRPALRRKSRRRSPNRRRPLGSLARDGEQVRRIAKQTLRAVDQQTENVGRDASPNQRRPERPPRPAKVVRAASRPGRPARQTRVLRGRSRRAPRHVPST